LVAGLVWLAYWPIGVDKWAWTLALAALQVVLYAALIFAFRVVTPRASSAMGNLLRLKG
jgi:hypothetical protein